MADEHTRYLETLSAYRATRRERDEVMPNPNGIWTNYDQNLDERLWNDEQAATKAFDDAVRAALKESR